MVDDAGIAHAAAELDGAIYYLTNAGGSWTRDPVSRPDAGAGRDPQIAIDADGSLVVAYATNRSGQFEDEPVVDIPSHPSHGVLRDVTFAADSSRGDDGRPIQPQLSTAGESDGAARTVLASLGT